MLTLAFSAPALAKDEDSAPPTPQVAKDVIDCLAVADSAARLACYDRTVGALESGIKERQVVVADRETVREARRGLFGLALPRIKLFGGADEAEEIKEITSTIKAVRSAGDGMPIFILADDSRWKQTEGRNVFARAGQSIRVRRTGVGGFMANVDGQTAVRVVRIAN
jgi:hypothetical protein